MTVFMDAELDAILDVGGEPPATREAFAQRLLTRPRARACESRFESLKPVFEIQVSKRVKALILPDLNGFWECLRRCACSLGEAHLWTPLHSDCPEAYPAI